MHDIRLDASELIVEPSGHQPFVDTGLQIVHRLNLGNRSP